ncbi:hypothetical protein CWIS_11885 [Cellulomonas sp. A375-1]|nr:hypothetical protein CWIS_11885 [Cellulomonas sp. A375-1]
MLLDRELLDGVAETREASSDLREREAGPPREVAHGGRTVPDEEAAHELAERLVAREVAAGTGRAALVGQRVGVQGAARATAHDDALELGVHHDERQAVGGRLDTLGGEGDAELRTRGVPARRQALDDARERHVRAHERLVVEPELAAPRRALPVHPRGRQREHPAQVLGCEQVPRGPQRVRAQDRAVVERAPHVVVRRVRASLAEGPPGDRELLPLHGELLGDDLTCASSPRAAQALGLEPAADDLGCAHAPRLGPRSHTRPTQNTPGANRPAGYSGQAIGTRPWQRRPPTAGPPPRQVLHRHNHSPRDLDRAA